VIALIDHQTTLDSNHIDKDTPTQTPRNDAIYRISPGGDRWACERCARQGDRFDVIDHYCKRIKKAMV
jgi:hypothetical protein